jgi:hypothetical protein
MKLQISEAFNRPSAFKIVRPVLTALRRQDRPNTKTMIGDLRADAV